MCLSLKIGFFDYQNIFIERKFDELSNFSNFKNDVCQLLNIQQEDSLQFLFQPIDNEKSKTLDQESFISLQNGFSIWILNQKSIEQLRHETYSNKDINSSIWLALSLISDKDGKENPSESAFLFRKGSESGNKTAQLFSYLCYSQGIGVPIDSSIAQTYFKSASDLIKMVYLNKNSQILPLTSLNDKDQSYTLYKSSNPSKYIVFQESKTYSSIGTSTWESKSSNASSPPQSYSNSSFHRTQYIPQQLPHISETSSQNKQQNINNNINHVTINPIPVNSANNNNKINNNKTINNNSSNNTIDPKANDDNEHLICIDIRTKSDKELVDLGKDFYSKGKIQESISVFSLARKKGNIEAIWRLGKSYSNVDYRKSISLYYEAMIKGSTYGTMLYAVSLIQINEKAGSYYLHLAAKTLPEAQFLFGIYLKDRGHKISQYQPYLHQSALGGDPNGAWTYYLSLGDNITNESLNLLYNALFKATNPYPAYILSNIFHNLSLKSPQYINNYLNNMYYYFQYYSRYPNVIDNIFSFDPISFLMKTNHDGYFQVIINKYAESLKDKSILMVIAQKYHEILNKIDKEIEQYDPSLTHFINNDLFSLKFQMDIT